MFLPNEDKLMQSGPVWHGAAIGWHVELDAEVMPLPAFSKRFMGVKLETHHGSILAISLYAPTAGQDDEYLECLDDLTEYIQSYMAGNDEIVIGTDANCCSKSTSRRKAAWKSFCEKFNLAVHSNHIPTFHHHNGSSESCIDFFLSSKSLRLTQLSQVCTLETPLNLSSHDPLVSKISVKKQKQSEPKYSHTYTEFNRERIIWDKSKTPEYQELAAKALTEASKYWSSPECIPLLCSLYSNLLVKSAKLVFNTKEARNPTAKITSIQPSRRILNAEKTLKRAHTKWKKEGKPKEKENPVRLKYCQAKSTLQYLRRYEDNLRNIKHNNELMQSSIHNRNETYSKVRAWRGSSARSTTSKLVTPVGTYFGSDVLEGFAADAEFLGRKSEKCDQFDNEFYNLCKEDNMFIFTFHGEDEVKIPAMTIADLENILFKKMKTGKACDIYHLTVEHIREAGLEAKLIILDLINKIIEDIYYLTCSQIKIGLGSALHKGKNKPVASSKSYRRITVTPQIGAILDRYIDPMAERLFKRVQSPDQLGFTANLSYLMAAVLRGECQRWAVDHKLTCFGVSLDGEAAFPSVDREIQVRELYSAGERGDLLSYSCNTYQNTECFMKIDGKLSRKFSEHRGNRQGHVRASGHYKAYINPCLNSLSDSQLGFNIGPICVTSVCIADDSYILSGSQSGLQAALNIVSHYSRRYKVVYNGEKTKLVVTGSPIDMKYYEDTTPWTLNGERIKVVENNDHLGLIVSGRSEEQKNIDQNIQHCINSLFALLGPAYAFNCQLSPAVQVHLWKTYNLPVLCSGLSALPIRPTQMKSINTFQKKILRSFLKLSSRSPIPSMFFLLGELPIEARIHLNTFSLFYTIWSNPQTTAHQVVRYILRMADSSSTTWAGHLRLLCQMYGISDPLFLIEKETPWSKDRWKTLTTTKVIIYHERQLRSKAARNSKMDYLNVQTLGLTGRIHPAVQNLWTTQDVRKARQHLKFLAGDYLTGEQLANENGGQPKCKLCLAPVETTAHIIVKCSALSDVRNRIMPELLNKISDIQPTSQVLKNPNSNNLTQFILDCTSTNLPTEYRISGEHPRVQEIYKLCRDWCYGIASERTRQLKLIST